MGWPSGNLHSATDMPAQALARKGALPYEASMPQARCDPCRRHWRLHGASMARRKKIYEGKAKILYEGPEPGTLVQYFKDDATAFNAEKKAVIEGKGVLNNRLSEFFMTGLQQYRRADPFHPPPQHARTADPPGRDHPARSDRAQLRRRLDGQAAGDGGGHAAAAPDRRILLQGRRARRSAGARGIHHRLRLGQPAGPGRHRRPGAAGERFHVGRDVRRRHQAGRFQDRDRPDLGQRFPCA